MRMKSALVLLVVLVAAGAVAQDGVLAEARSMAASGKRAEALRLLETQLLLHPRDDDARLVYGIILSWERQFDRARRELQAVLANNPRYLDARLALVRVELWSGHTDEGERLINESLRMFPENQDLLTLRAQARSNPQRRQVSLGGNYDQYESIDDWREMFLEIKLPTRIGPVLGRVSHAVRLGRDDDQIEIEAYPRLGNRAYAFLSAGHAPDAILYPETRLGAEIYYAFGRGFEASLGMRRLNFAESGGTSVYTGSIGKYLRDWLISVRVYDSEADTAAQLMARRYWGDYGSYAGFRFGRGSSRDDVRSIADLQSLEAWETALEGLVAINERWLVNARAGVGRASKQDRWSVSAALGRRF